MTIDLGAISPPPPDRDAAPGGRRDGVRRPGLLRRALRAAGPGDWLGRREIREGGAAIGGLARAIRSGDAGRGPFRTFADGTFDLAGTAAVLGIGERALLARLAERRRQTARAAWGLWGLAAAFLAAWLWQALALELTAARLVSLASFLPFILLFMVLGAQQALTNFQIRSGRAAGWREWVGTEGRFWPG